MPVGSLLALSAAALSPVGPSGLCKAGSFLSFANLSSRLAALGPAILWTLDPPWPCASTPPPSCSFLKPEFQRRLITMMIKVATVARSPKATWPGHAALAASSVLRALTRAPMGPGLSSCSPPCGPRHFCEDVVSDPGRRPTPPLAARGHQSSVTSSAVLFVAWLMSASANVARRGHCLVLLSTSPAWCSGNTSEQIGENQKIL